MKRLLAAICICAPLLGAMSVAAGPPPMEFTDQDENLPPLTTMHPPPGLAPGAVPDRAPCPASHEGCPAHDLWLKLHSQGEGDYIRL